MDLQEMGSVARVTYQGFRAGEGWDVVVKRPGQPLRLLDPPPPHEKLPLNILTDYLGDEGRAAGLYRDFAAITRSRFAGDWELSDSDIENALMEVEILRARLRIVLARG
jgi:hypothetical protein